MFFKTGDPTIPTGYEVHHTLSHEQMLPFVQQYLRKFSNPVIRIYWLFNLIVLLMLGYLFLFFPTTIDKGLTNIGLGICSFFLLIPLHEWIHGIAYKISGAPKVSYHAVLRKLIFYALADRFVIGYRSFLFVAFSPFIIITTLLTILLFSTETLAIAWVCWAGLLIHTSGCAGDFALAAYFYEERNRAPLTYDLQEEGITVFLRKSTTPKKGE